MHSRPKQGLGLALSLYAFEEMYLSINFKSSSEDIFAAIAGWSNRNKIIQSGKCRAILTPI